MDAKVGYLIVGDVAVVLHGHLHTTADLDLVIGLDEENVRRAMVALESLGLRPRAPVPAVPASQFADAEIREVWIREKGLTVFSMWSPEMPRFEVDLFVREPFHFAEVHGRAVRVALDACEATVISVDDLLDLKKRAGRPRDLEDVAALEALLRRETMPDDEPRAPDANGFDRGYEEHQRRQARLGLSMTPAERLAWLERKNAEMHRLLGRARRDRER